jgi:hypothetical protein
MPWLQDWGRQYAQEQKKHPPDISPWFDARKLDGFIEAFIDVCFQIIELLPDLVVRHFPLMLPDLKRLIGR